MTDYDKELREAWERWEEEPKEPAHSNPEDSYREENNEHIPEQRLS